MAGLKTCGINYLSHLKVELSCKYRLFNVLLEPWGHSPWSAQLMKRLCAQLTLGLSPGQGLRGVVWGRGGGFSMWSCVPRQKSSGL